MKEVGLVSILVLVILSIAGWLTHIISCLMTGKYVLLIAGAFVAPVGIIHGIGLWFGIQW